MEKLTAAHSLRGQVLNEKWKVLKKIQSYPGATGGFFSVCYEVQNTETGQNAFLKALNFEAFFQMFPGKNIVEILYEQTQAYKYERDILLLCKSKRLSKVATILDEGELYLASFTIPNVPFLIFELAETDVRNKLSFAKDLDNAWKLQSLHDTAVGLRQLHSAKITHQDLKPSNVLLYHDSTISKIGDLGRSLCESIQAPHDNGTFTGDFRYAPPELLYGYYLEDASIRKYATDCYLFGSMIVFYFIGLNMTSLLAKNINKDFKWTKWHGAYAEVLSYVLEAYELSINEFKSQIENETLKEELGQIVEYLCFPKPEKRGHPRSILLRGSQYSLERFITRLDYLSKKAKYKFI